MLLQFTDIQDLQVDLDGWVKPTPPGKNVARGYSSDTLWARLDSFLDSAEYETLRNRLKDKEIFLALDKRDSMYASTDSTYNDRHYQRTRGKRQYQLKNHLGNVMATITDRKLPHNPNPDSLADYYTADIVTADDYYPFGMQMPGRHWTADSSDQYRFGFNGKEKDNEVKGHGNSYNFGARIYDPRVSRWLSMDPKQKKFPDVSPYNFGKNNPVIFIDEEGQENVVYLVILPSAYNHISKKKVDDIVAQANENYDDMNLNTRVKQFQGEDFNPEHMDKTDAVAVLGKKDKVIDYTKKNLSKSYGKHLEKSFEGGMNNPEESQNSYGSGGKFIAIDAKGASETAKFINENSQFESTSVSKIEVIADLVNHGSGHNAGLDHDKGDFMKSGTELIGLLTDRRVKTDFGWMTYKNEDFKNLEDFYTEKGNKKARQEMIDRFGNEKAEDNYNENKKGAQPEKGTGQEGVGTHQDY